MHFDLERWDECRGMEQATAALRPNTVEDSMASSLVSLIMQFLTPDIVSRMASVLGLDRSSAQSAIGAAVPALLAGLSRTAAKPGGAQSLVDTISQQSGVLDSFADRIGSGQLPLLDQGSTLLKSVLGGQDQSALASAVSRFADIGQGASNSLLAMLAPVAVGVIGKQLGSRNLDASSLTGLLTSQKDQIAHALPAGFGNLLAGTGILDSLSGATSSAAAMAGQAKQAATAATGQIAGIASSGAYTAGRAGQRAVGAATSAIPAWTYWALPMLVVAGLIWYLMGRPTEQATRQVTQPAATAVQSVMVDGVDIGKQLGDGLASLRTSLPGITDVASAREALPKLQAATAQVEKVNGVMGQLSADQRKVIAELAAPANVALNQLFDKVLAIPGVNDVLKPVVDPLRTTLADLSAQSVTTGFGRQ
jgi:hypothetical protein